MLVGVFLLMRAVLLSVARLPHARGGVSQAGKKCGGRTLSSPCSWGCFLWDRPCINCKDVFPMLVGVFLLVTGYDVARRGLPHARGGVSH